MSIKRRDLLVGTMAGAALTVGQQAVAATRITNHVSPVDFGATGDGVANDTSAFKSALASLATTGGILDLGSYSFWVRETITVPPNVTIVGQHVYPGNSGSNLNSILTHPSRIKLDGSARINLSSNAGISGVTIINSAITSIPAGGASAFSGWAVNIQGHDAAVVHCLILGFSIGVHSVGNPRLKVDSTSFDCSLYCIFLSGSKDVSRISNIHCWPYLDPRVGYSTRDGATLRLDSSNHWTEVINFSSYHYKNGFIVGASGVDSDGKADGSISASSCSFINCHFDGALGHSVHGFYFIGHVQNCRFSQCKIKHARAGMVFIKTIYHTPIVSIMDCQFLDIAKWGIALRGGAHAQINGCYIEEARSLESNTYPVYIDSSVSKATISNVMFAGYQGVSPSVWKTVCNRHDPEGLTQALNISL